MGDRLEVASFTCHDSGADSVFSWGAQARNELPPLPPPLSSGWRPVPSATADTGWMQDQRDGGRKRSWDGR